VLPIEPRALGFGSEWYKPAVENAVAYRLPSNHHVRMVSGPYFLMTKLDAFDARGGGDYLLSHDIEDIVAVLDGRPTIVEEVAQADPDLAQAISERFDALLRDERFVDAVSGHLPSDQASQARAAYVLDRIRKLAN